MSEFRSEIRPSLSRDYLTNAQVKLIQIEYRNWTTKEISDLRQQLDQSQAIISEMEKNAKFTKFVSEKEHNPDHADLSTQAAIKGNSN